MAIFTPTQKANYDKLMQIQMKLNTDAMTLQRQPIK